MLVRVNMSKHTIEAVERDAEIMWWARDSLLEMGTTADGAAHKNKVKFRKWVKRNTAIGPWEKGGLNMMDWGDHVGAFKAEWVIRYLDPSDTKWKEMWDSFILYDNTTDEGT